MKAANIQIGNLYEVKAGRNVTVVKVKSVNKTTGCWVCETPKGKKMTIADAERFVRDVTPGKESKIGKAAPAKAIGKKASLREVIEAKGITIIPKNRRATSTMRDLDDPTFTRNHRVTKKGVLVLEADEKPKHLGPKPLGNMSALSAAHRVLKEAGKPMRIREIMETAIGKGYCELHGKTPFCTFNGGIQKEVKTKGDNSRFVWVDKGLFAAR